MTTASEKPTTRPWGRYLFLVGLILFMALGWHYGWRNLAGLVQGASLTQLALMTAFIVAGFWIRAWKWHYALGSGQQGIRLFFIAKTAGSLTPGRAGEFAPLLLREHRNARVAAWIGLDRLVEIAGTLGLGLMGAAYIGRVPWSIVALGCIGGSVALLIGWHLLGKEWLRYIDDPSAPAHGTWRSRMGRMINMLRDELQLFGAKMPLVLGTTAIAKLTDIYAVVVLCSAFGYEAPFLVVCAARCAHALVSAVPVTPDATGVPYIAAAGCLNVYAGIPYDTLMAALGLEVIVINGVLWGCFWLVSFRRFTSGPSAA